MSKIFLTGLSSVATPFGAGFPFNAANNPAIQNYVQRTLNNALQQSPVNYLSYPQNNFVNPSKYVVSPQNNNPNYAIVPQNKPGNHLIFNFLWILAKLFLFITAPATRRPTFQYPGESIYCEFRSNNKVCQLIM